MCCPTRCTPTQQAAKGSKGHLKLSGNEVDCTNALLLPIEIMLCSKLDFQKVLIQTLFLQDPCPHSGQPRHFRGISWRRFVSLPVGTPLCPDSVVYRGSYRSYHSGLFQKPLCNCEVCPSVLCGRQAVSLGILSRVQGNLAHRKRPSP